jgi:hypothetical protein
MIHAIPPEVADVYITDELYRRDPGNIDVLSKKIALQEIAAVMADDPSQVLPKFVSLAMQMTDGVSAGLSLYEENLAGGIFRWHHLAGTLAHFSGNAPLGIIVPVASSSI